MSNENRTKLRTLLQYWIEHNKEHSQEFKEWASRAEESGETEISKEILEAVHKMDETSECLLRALKKLEQKEL